MGNHLVLACQAFGFSQGGVSPAGGTGSACWYFPVKQNWCKERRNELLSALGCQFFLTSKKDVLLQGRWRREGRWGRADPAVGCEVLPLPAPSSIRLLTSSLKAGSALGPGKECPLFTCPRWRRKAPAPRPCANKDLYGWSSSIWWASAWNLRLPVGSCCSPCGCFIWLFNCMCSVLMSPTYVTAMQMLLPPR